MSGYRVSLGSRANECVMSAANVTCKRELVIIGAGGFGTVAAWVADEMNSVALKHDRSASWEVVGYADLDAAKRGTRHAGRVVHGTIEDVDRDFRGHGLWSFCAIGDNCARATMVRLAEQLG